MYKPGKEELDMKQEYVGSIVIIAVCVIILLIGSLKDKAAWVINFVLRGIVGALFICVCNTWMDGQHIIGKVGLNPLSLLTSASLGIPGVLGLYGIRFFLNL